MQVGNRFVSDAGTNDELGAVVQRAWADYRALRGQRLDCPGCRVAVTAQDGLWLADVLSPVNERLAQYEVRPGPQGEFQLELVFARTDGPHAIGRHEEESE